jgi:ATP-dependent RNA/DNA helicase IGHMBP2
MLTKQFRMHKTIASFISQTFYENRIKTDQRTLLAKAPSYTPNSFILSGLYWVQYGKHSVNAMGNVYHEEKMKRSCTNSYEVEEIYFLLELLLDLKIYETRSVSVIGYYKLIIQDLSEKVEANPKLTPLLKKSLFLHTVDSSQGSEADIVILSCVRSNGNGDLGFLSEGDGPNRICVSCSRAREALIVVGDERTLKHLREFKILMSYALPSVDGVAPMQVLSSTKEIATNYYKLQAKINSANHNLLGFDDVRDESLLNYEEMIDENYL